MPTSVDCSGDDAAAVTLKKRRLAAMGVREGEGEGGADGADGEDGDAAQGTRGNTAADTLIATTTAKMDAAGAETSPSSSPAPRVLEFYCGVGGLHYALQRARPRAEVVAAFDINPNSNDVYEHNFGLRPRQKNLFGSRGVPAAQIDKLAASVWLMSPPCQPFTRQGLQKDTADARSQSFLRLLDVVPVLEHPPTHILVENVVGFETSEMRDVLRETLRAMGFSTREHILSPRQFGVPYSRPRYFLLAKRAPLRWVDQDHDHLHNRDHGDAEVSGGAALAGEVSGGGGGERGGGIEGGSLRRFPPPSRLSTPSEWVPAVGLSLLREVDPVEATVTKVKPRAGGVGERSDSHRGDEEGTAAAAAEEEDREPKGGKVGAEGGGGGGGGNGRGRVLYGVAPLSCFMEHHRHHHGGSGGGGGEAGVAQSENDVWTEYGVPQKEVYKSLAAIDVVLPEDRKCNCFTKSYGRYVKGTGSFVANRAVMKGRWDGTVVNGEAAALHAAKENGEEAEKGEGAAAAAGSGGGGGGGEGVMLRYFTEREVANIHSFPPEFSFPAHITRGQRYALLGNSLSVACVAPLIDYLLTDAA